MRAIGMAFWTAAALLAQPALAQGDAPACAPAHLFDGARTIAAARTLGGDPNPVLTIGEPAELTLRAARTLILVAPPGKPVEEGDRGGLVRLHVAMSGTYRVALGGKAWIDVVANGVPLTSVAHGHGAPCSGIAKQVDFALAPGDYTIQLTEAPAGTDTLGLLVTKLP